MVNRYTNVNWNNPISMQIPRPFAEMDAIGRRTQDSYDKGKQLPGIMGEISAKIKAAPYHQDYKDQVLNGYNDQMNSLVDKYHGNYGSPDFQMDASKLISKLSNSQDLQTIQAEGKAFDNYQEKYAQDPKNQRDLNFSLPNGQIHEGHLIKHGINVVPFAEHTKDASSYTEHIIPDSNAISSIQPHQDGFMYVLKNGEHQFINGNRIKQIAQQAVPSYAGTAGGDFRMKKFLSENIPQLGPQLSKLGYEQIKDMLPERAGQALDSYLANDIEAQGQQKIHDQTKLTQGLHNDALAKTKFNNQIANQTTSTQSEGLSTNTLLDATKDLKFKDGKLELPLTRTMENKIQGKSELEFKSPTGPEILDKQKYTASLQLINNLKQEHPELASLSDEKVVNSYREAVKSLHSESIPLNSISNLAAKGIGEAIARNKTQRNFYLYDSKGKTEDGTLQTVLDKLDIKEEDFDKALKSGVSGYTQAGPSAGSYYIEVKDGDGNSRRVMISPDEEMKRMFSVSQAVNEARKTMSNQVVSPIPGVDYQVAIKPSISKDGKVNWKYIEVINGKPRETTLDDIRKEEREALKASPFLGSQVQDTKDEEKDIE